MNGDGKDDKAMGLMVVGFLIKRKRLFSVVVTLAILTALLLTYLVLI